MLNTNDEKDFKLKLIKKMYKKDIDRIIELNNLKYPVSSSGMTVFDCLPAQGIFGKYSLVVGGACIDRCQGKVANLGINFYYDILMPLNFALEHSLSVGIYVDTPIEVEVKSSESLMVWLKFVHHVESFLDNLSKKIGIPIKVIRRDKGVKLLDDILNNVKFTDAELKGLYDLVPSEKNVFTDDLLLNFRRSICSYLPVYLSEYFDEEIKNTIVVEALSQIKAVVKAKDIDCSVVFKDYLDMPSVTCKNRMHRSRTGKVKIFDSLDTVYKTDDFNLFLNKINMQKIFEIFGVIDFIEICNVLNTMWGNLE